MSVRASIAIDSQGKGKLSLGHSIRKFVLSRIRVWFSLVHAQAPVQNLEILSQLLWTLQSFLSTSKLQRGPNSAIELA